MIQLLLDGAYQDIELVHLRMGFSKELKSTGKLKAAKFWELLRVIVAIYWIKLRMQPKVLYYPPAGPSLGNLCTSSKSTISLYKVEGGWVKRCDR
jgi:hypothetical protein